MFDVTPVIDKIDVRDRCSVAHFNGDGATGEGAWLFGVYQRGTYVKAGKSVVVVCASRTFDEALVEVST